MTNKAFLHLASISVGAALVSIASADLHFDSRVNDYSVGFSDMQFSNGSFDGTVTTSVTADQPGDSFLGADFGLPTGTSLTSWVGDGNVNVQNVQNFGTDATADIFDPSGVAGAFHIRFGGNTPGGAGAFYGDYVLGGQHVFEVNASSPGFVDDGGTYLWGLTMPGDWSAVGTGIGDHELLGLNAAWTIESDFVYDPIHNQTYFSAYNGDYLNNGL